jgi:hypothetical protein
MDAIVSTQVEQITVLTNLKRVLAKPTPLELATKELIEAEHAKLAAQSAAEYATSLVSYNDKRIFRLMKYINEFTKTTA